MSSDVVVESMEDVEGLVAAAPLTGPWVDPWTILVPRVDRLDHAPGMHELLATLQEPSLTRLCGWDVTPVDNLRAVADVSGLLGLVVARIDVLLRGERGLPHRPHYSALRRLANDIREAADGLPDPALDDLCSVASHIHAVAKRGRRYHGRPALRMRRGCRLGALRGRVSRLQQESPMDIDPLHGYARFAMNVISNVCRSAAGDQTE